MATKNGKVLTMVDEKIINLNVISSISVSTLQDDWVVLHVDSSPDGDTILCCTFKTELLAHMLQQTSGRIKVSVTPQIQYKKKGSKAVTMKFVKDETAKGDGIYKSHVVKICSGEPVGSQSKPPCAVQARPTQNSTRRAAAAPRKTPTANRNAPRPAAPAATVNNSRPMANNAGRSVPPPPPPPTQAATPPPPPPPAPSTPQYKAIYPFQSQEAGEIAFEKGDLLEIVEKDENGWWLARKDGIEGWVPSNYLEEYVPPVARATPPPPPPPARRAPPSIPVATKVSSPPPAASSTVPAWKAELEARKSGAIPNSGASSANSVSPVPAARRGPPAPGPKPMVPTKPSAIGKPVVPLRPGVGAPTPAPRAPPRASNGTPSNAAASLADAVSSFLANYIENKTNSFSLKYSFVHVDSKLLHIMTMMMMSGRKPYHY
jgi:myosin-1